eukprot:scaffold23659_cov205-Skeletonema_marinoi.AAC.5
MACRSSVVERIGGVGKFNEVDSYFSSFMVLRPRQNNGWRIATVFCTYSYAALAVERFAKAKSTQQHRNQNQPPAAEPIYAPANTATEEPIEPQPHHRLLIITMPPKVRVKIPIHVLVYSLGFFPAAAYGEI